MIKIVDIKNDTHDVKCIACAIQDGEIILPIERIAETENFFVEQDLEWPIEGFMVIISKRHILSIDELSDKEAEEFCKLVRATRMVLRRVLGISAVTLVQEESTTTSHFHFWLFPWHNWMREKWNGKLYEIRDIMEYAKQEFSGKENLEAIKRSAVKLRQEIRTN